MCGNKRKPDFSFLLYEKYFSLSNREIEITLRNKTVLKGRITGFFLGSQNSNDPFVQKWHVINMDDASGVDIFGCTEGHIIWHKDIACVYFYDDHSQMKFSSL